jgi:acyl-CoA synthetase (AMP-forming)/AMP-acid ligase II
MEAIKDLTLLSVIERSARMYGHKHAISYTDEPPITYAELWKQIKHVSGFLHSQVPGTVLRLSGRTVRIGELHILPSPLLERRSFPSYLIFILPKYITSSGTRSAKRFLSPKNSFKKLKTSPLMD